MMIPQLSLSLDLFHDQERMDVLGRQQHHNQLGSNEGQRTRTTRAIVRTMAHIFS